MRTLLPAAVASAILFLAVGTAAAAPCDDAIARWQRILNQDIKLGRVDKEVYQAAMASMVPVTATCKAGRSAEAIAQLNAIKKRHGYPI